MRAYAPAWLLPRRHCDDTVRQALSLTGRLSPALLVSSRSTSFLSVRGSDVAGPRVAAGPLGLIGQQLDYSTLICVVGIRKYPVIHKGPWLCVPIIRYGLIRQTGDPLYNGFAWQSDRSRKAHALHAVSTPCNDLRLPNRSCSVGTKVLTEGEQKGWKKESRRLFKNRAPATSTLAANLKLGLRPLSVKRKSINHLASHFWLSTCLASIFQ